MTVTEEPLHVQVALALGWTDPEYKSFPTAFHGDIGLWYGTPPPVKPRSNSAYEHACAIMMNIPREIRDYTVSGWAEILERERYNLTVVMTNQYKNRCVDVQAGKIPTWFAQEGDGLWALGDSPGEAVCKLFVRLHAEKENS